jgi:hypothetical protein
MISELCNIKVGFQQKHKPKQQQLFVQWYCNSTSSCFRDWRMRYKCRPRSAVECNKYIIQPHSLLLILILRVSRGWCKPASKLLGIMIQSHILYLNHSLQAALIPLECPHWWMSKIIQIDDMLRPHSKNGAQRVYYTLLKTPHLNKMQQRDHFGAGPSKLHGWRSTSYCVPTSQYASFMTLFRSSLELKSIACEKLILQCCNHKWRTKQNGLWIASPLFYFIEDLRLPLVHRHYSEEYMAGLMRFLGDLQNDSPEMDRSLLKNIFAESSYRG